MKRSFVAASIAAVTACAHPHQPPQPDAPFLRSVFSVDTVAGVVTLPALRGHIRGTPVWYIVTESSDQGDARRRGVTWAPRLRALAGTAAVQFGQVNDGTLEYSAGVDFAPERTVRPAPDSGFPALVARPGSVARPGYSPFVQLRGGVIVNAPIIANASGALDRVISLDSARGQVRLHMSRGYYDDRHAWYISTEASDETVAAFERATYVPALAAAPAAGSSDATSARSGILAISNGVISRASPDRQGMQSALVNDLSPLNVLQHAPDPSQRDSAYSPLWDLRLVRWTAAAIASNQREKVFSWGDGASFIRRGLLTGPVAGIAINCPLMVTYAREAPAGPPDR